MNSHKNARLAPKGREILVRRLERGERPADVACAMGISLRTVYKWRGRYRDYGSEGLQDRSSRPSQTPGRTPASVEARVVQLRRERRIMERIAEETGVSRATVGRILARHGLNRWRDLEPSEPVVRYERDRPGDLIHIDIKKLGKFTRTGHRITGDRTGQSNTRGIGWEFMHVCIDDHSRLGFSQVLASERKEDAVAFLNEAVAWYRKLEIGIERVMTDNGSCYKSHAFRAACKALGLRHIRTRPYTPKTNGKAERFIQSSLREWAYARAYQTSEQRKAELPYWLLTLTATPHKIGRTVASVTIAWEEKEAEKKQSTKAELDRPRVGRKARRDGTAETPVTAFPASGSVKNTEPWDRIARDNAPRIDGRHVPDLRMLADTFRKWCGEKSISLDTASIEKTFTTWCKSYSAR